MFQPNTIFSRSIVQSAVFVSDKNNSGPRGDLVTVSLAARQGAISVCVQGGLREADEHELWGANPMRFSIRVSN